MINNSGVSSFGSTGTLLREERGTNFMGFEMEEERLGVGEKKWGTFRRFLHFTDLFLLNLLHS